ncbi:MAG TPA: ChaN family lipoprotein [Vicinamibacteria bacterium]|nr:ChaN family lipoprotein [Vicinamibacteria bacterium]
MTRTACLAALVLCACAPSLGADERALNLPIGDPARKDREAALVLDGITDAARGDTLTPPELAARLGGVRLLFVGESHTDVEFHKAQLRVLRELHARGRQVFVGLEMYPVPEQQWLDRWHSDEALTEEGFLAESHWYRNWGYHWNYYRDIFLFARANGIRMFGVNLPRPAVQTIRMKGFDALPPDQRALLPERGDLESAEHQRLFKAFFGSEDALHANMPEPMFQAMFRAQCAWDAAMGWNALQALKKHGGETAIMVVLIGAGHVAYGLGAERQVKPWFDGKTASLIPVPIAEEPGGTQVSKVQASYADFVWGLPPSTDPLYPSVGITTPEQKSGERYKVIMVTKESPAEAAGFKVGDELVSIDGTPYADKETVNRLMSEKRWGDAVVYEVMRDGQKQTLSAYLRRRPPKAKVAGDAPAERPAEMPKMPPAGMPAMPPAMPPKPPSGGGQ